MIQNTKNTRREFLQITALAVLGCSFFSSIIQKISFRREPILIAIGQCGCSVLNQCQMNGISGRFFAIERKEDRFIYPDKTLRAYVNPDNTGKYEIHSFKGIADCWIKEILSGCDKSKNPAIIASSIGNEYEAIAGRGVFNCLLENKVNVIWLVSYPSSNEGLRSNRAASQYTEDIAHLPNVISLYKDDVREKYADNRLFIRVRDIIRTPIGSRQKPKLKSLYLQ